MNLNQGLTRVSIVFWSLCALLWSFPTVAILAEVNNNPGGMYSLLGYPAIYAGHRASKWIIDGFINPTA